MADGTIRVRVDMLNLDAIENLLCALDYYRSGMEHRAPKWVPSRVLLKSPVRGEFPVGHTSLVEAGEHDCESNRFGSISIRAKDGKMLGIKPTEFQPLKWRPNGPR